MKITSYKKGFTLIELLVVIAIIGLLSSIVLASLKDARDRANASKFKSEINQFINALELYKNDKGVYPAQENPDVIFGFTTTISAGVRADATTAVTGSFPSYASYVTALNPYIKSTPVPPTMSTDTQFRYSHATNVAQPRMCVGDNAAKLPSYIILVTSNVPGFENWPFLDSFLGPNTNYRCFSLK
ncbi:prepilin-type N-terminal cleavage/methylation domain-containing protein [Candidatus Parcubacteria bacterium]|nr:prepilin-type N-terminal cleavage/methylation domain-containing protein [Candidatus Parcubacteria bacterium]